MPRLKLTLQYDGTRYAGWQVQPNGPSIQAAVQGAFATLRVGDVPVTGASRTDAGVHAVGQVCHVDVPATAAPTERLLRGLNGVLPRDIRVTRIESVPPDFHARYSARAKAYRYLIAGGGIVPPLVRHAVWAHAAPLDVAAMRMASTALPGTHDFAAFCAAGSHVRDTVRTIHSVELEEIAPTGLTSRDAPLLAFDITGTGFLYKMVRLLVGTLVEIGTGRYPTTVIHDLLAAPDTERVRLAAPAQGLTLCWVQYGEWGVPH